MKLDLRRQLANTHAIPNYSEWTSPVEINAVRAKFMDNQVEHRPAFADLKEPNKQHNSRVLRLFELTIPDDIRPIESILSVYKYLGYNNITMDKLQNPYLALELYDNPYYVFLMGWNFKIGGYKAVKPLQYQTAYGTDAFKRGKAAILRLLLTYLDHLDKTAQTEEDSLIEPIKKLGKQSRLEVAGLRPIKKIKKVEPTNLVHLRGYTIHYEPTGSLTSLDVALNNIAKILGTFSREHNLIDRSVRIDDATALNTKMLKLELKGYRCLEIRRSNDND